MNICQGVLSRAHSTLQVLGESMRCSQVDHDPPRFLPQSPCTEKQCATSADPTSDSQVPAQVVLFCSAAVQGMTLALGCLLADAFPQMRKHTIRDVPVAYVVSCCTAVATAALWAVCRNRDWAWMLQDALGATLIMFFIRTIQLPSLKVRCHVTCFRKSSKSLDTDRRASKLVAWGSGFVHGPPGNMVLSTS